MRPPMTSNEAADANACPATRRRIRIRQANISCRGEFRPAKSSCAPLAAIAPTTARCLILGKITAACPRNAQLRKPCLQACGRVGRNALRAAEKIDGEIARGGAGAKPLDKFDARDALAQRRSMATRNGKHADRIAERERRMIDDRSKLRIALRVHDHLGPQRDDLRACGLARERENAIRRLLRVGRIEPAAENFQALSPALGGLGCVRRDERQQAIREGSGHLVERQAAFAGAKTKLAHRPLHRESGLVVAKERDRSNGRSDP